MNYYEHHLGDYAKDTTSLTMLEEGAYRRLIDAYYIKEKPLPVEEMKVFKLARASTKQEKVAVRSVLDEFFSLQPDGFHHKRCDEEIERYRVGQEESDGKRENENERQKRHRAERKEMFATLRARSIVPPWDASTATLRALIGGEAVTPPVTPHVTGAVTPPVTRTATANHTQTPDTSPQTPMSLIPLSPNGLSTAFPEKAGEGDLLGDPVKTGIPDCPQQKVLAMWASLMPELQQPVKWTEARATALRTRWREEAAQHGWTTEDDGLRVFAKLFRWCRQSPFLMGKSNPRTPGGSPFSLTLPWLTKAENWAKVQEGNYHPEG